MFCRTSGLNKTHRDGLSLTITFSKWRFSLKFSFSPDVSLTKLSDFTFIVFKDRSFNFQLIIIFTICEILKTIPPPDSII